MAPLEIKLNSPFQLGDCLVDPGACRIYRDNRDIKLEPRAMQVLLCLAQESGMVLSREVLEASVWPGMVVGYDSLPSSIIKIRKALGDNTRQPRYIETVSKKGYRLIAPLRTGIEADAAAGDAPGPARTGPLKRSAYIYSIVLALLVSGLLSWLYLANRGSTGQVPVATDQPPTVLILPFTNLSNDPQQAYLSEGITDDITTDLSGLARLRVIARHSASEIRNRTIPVSEAARKLHVRYIIEGSVQKSSQRIRINVQLTDLQQKRQVWAARYDRELKNVFEIQDQITSKVIQAMTITLSGQENQALSRRATTNFDAYDAFLQGQQYTKFFNEEGFDQAELALRRAIKLDPGYARAYGALAVNALFRHRYRFNTRASAEVSESALRMARKAVRLDPASPLVHWSLGFVLVELKQHAQAEQAARRAVELSPNFADGYALQAYIANWRGKHREAIAYLNKAYDLNPYYTFDYPWNYGMANYYLENYREAAGHLKEALQRNPAAIFVRLHLAACYLHLGQRDDAEWELEQVRSFSPGMKLSTVRQIMPLEKTRDLDKLLTDLRRIGLQG